MRGVNRRVQAKQYADEFGAEALTPVGVCSVVHISVRRPIRV
jgi:hypothetical protein